MTIHIINQIEIETINVYPPVPWRFNDWSAHVPDHDGEGPCGWGATEQEAIDQLMERIEEES